MHRLLDPLNSRVLAPQQQTLIEAGATDDVAGSRKEQRAAPLPQVLCAARPFDLRPLYLVPSC